jgi:hypothetical protein
MNYMGFCHSERSEESRIHLNTNVPRSEREMFRFAQFATGRIRRGGHDKRSAARFFS